MQKGVILGCGNRSNAGMDTVAKLTWSTKLQLQNLVPTWALGDKGRRFFIHGFLGQLVRPVVHHI
jgi:hypothetical protein